MINPKDVIRMYVPFPSISSQLAVSKHMYVCKYREDLEYEYVKCQTFKPALLSNGTIKHGVVEYPESNRNPFKAITIIDCDKLFCSSSVKYGNELLTSVRKDISQKVYDKVIRELEADGVHRIKLDEDGLCSINQFILKA